MKQLDKTPHIYHIISNRRTIVGSETGIQVSYKGDINVGDTVTCEGITGEVGRGEG